MSRNTVTYRCTVHLPDNSDPRATSAGDGTGNHFEYFLERLEEHVQKTEQPEFFVLAEVCRLHGHTRAAVGRMHADEKAAAMSLAEERFNRILDHMSALGYTRWCVSRRHTPMEKQSDGFLAEYEDMMAIVAFTTLPESEVAFERVQLTDWSHIDHGNNTVVVAKRHGQPIVCFTHAPLARFVGDPMMTHFIAAMTGMRALGCPVIGDLNVLPVHFKVFADDGEHREHADDFAWFCGDYLDVPDFRTHDIGHIPMGVDPPLPDHAYVQYRYDVNEEKTSSGLVGTLVQCSKGVTMTDMLCPYKGMPSVFHCKRDPEAANRIFVDNLPDDYEPVADHFAGVFAFEAPK